MPEGTDKRWSLLSGVLLLLVVTEQISLAQRTPTEQCHDRSHTYFEQAMRFIASGDPRGDFTVLAACGSEQICMAPERGQSYSSQERVFDVNRFLYDRWHAANIDGAGSPEWRAAITYCNSVTPLFPGYADTQCAARLIQVHNLIDLSAAFQQTNIGCLVPPDLNLINSVIASCLRSPLYRSVGSPVLGNVLRLAAGRANCPLN